MQAGDARLTDTRADEQERGITIKSTGISLYYQMSDESLKAFTGQRDGNDYLVNLIDSPGHVDFSSEVTAALRITDGALVVVDCVEGVCVQTETVLRQALGERIRPVLTVNKMDRCFLELMLDGEEAFNTYLRVIENANVILATYQDDAMGDLQVYPDKGTVSFSAGLHGWAFTLTTFAKLYAAKFGTDEKRMMDKLWGDNFFDPTTKKWTSKHTGEKTCKRGFVQFCYEPIKQVIELAMTDNREKLFPMLEKLNVMSRLKADDKDLTGKPFMKRIMQCWLPADQALLEMIVYSLPSPAAAQRYRVDVLYEGPLDDVYATAVRNCDAEGPLMVYISKMIPSADKGRFFAFGRVFAGKIATGSKVRILGPNYIPGMYAARRLAAGRGGGTRGGRGGITSTTVFWRPFELASGGARSAVAVSGGSMQRLELQPADKLQPAACGVSCSGAAALAGVALAWGCSRRSKEMRWEEQLQWLPGSIRQLGVSGKLATSEAQ